MKNSRMTLNSQSIAKLMVSPAVILLIGWMIVPLSMTVYFSFLRYNLLSPGEEAWTGLLNYKFFFSDPAFASAVSNTLILVFGVLLVTVVGGIALATLLTKPIWGRGVVRILTIAPFFVMPTVSALIWKNMFMNPVNGLFAHLSNVVGLTPYEFFSHSPLTSIVLIVAWQWLPFSTLILLTALQSLDSEQQEAAEMDGAGTLRRFYYITFPHLSRAITVVILVQSIFLLSIFAEILVTTNGGPGTSTTNLTFLVYTQSLLQFDVGIGSAGGVVAVIFANIVAFFLMRAVGRNLEA